MSKKRERLAIRAWAAVTVDGGEFILRDARLPLFWRREPCKRFIEESGHDAKVIRVEIWKVAQ